jgi:hypothetical protein
MMILKQNYFFSDKYIQEEGLAIGTPSSIHPMGDFMM